MDTNVIYRLIVIGVALVAIGIGAVMIYAGRYLAAPEAKKQGRARNMMLYGIIFVILSFAYLIYSMIVLKG